jgi:hypothetical protein
VQEFANPSAGTPRVLREKEVHVIADAIAKGMADAIENHQVGKPFGVAHCPFVIGDGLLGFGDGRVLVPEHVGPKPAIDGFLVGFEYVLAQAKTTMNISFERDLMRCQLNLSIKPVHDARRGNRCVGSQRLHQNRWKTRMTNAG